jgi:3-methylcrotonyl-CoA carboxylase alpha subunit
MFNKVLIANRGEIACRVATTCRQLGIRSVAVYSDADADAKHVALCDEAVHVGGPLAADSYLRIEAIVAAACASGAEAIHPGYGFLSENERFAKACTEHGIVFIGPDVAALAAMGSKAAAKTLMEAAGVPLVPGYHGAGQDPGMLQREAERIGYPVLLKASAGGGGKGMRVVDSSAGFAAALASCQREAASSFGDDRVLLEKYLLRPRHVEVQVFADRHGNAIYLFDRDCSVQRRHQKVLEEAPAPGLADSVRRAMGEAAVAAARAVDYVGAGTVEFIMAQDGTFFFMEMNTRLQVEHPVTEMITGFDLVEWQLRVAAGEPLPARQADLQVRGHAIEARVYAENPERGFLPSTGKLLLLRMPAAVEFTTSAGGRPTVGEPGLNAAQATDVTTAAAAWPATVRIDSGVREGDTITAFYDPMIAKLIVHGADRPAALARLVDALGQIQVVGPSTNTAFLRRIAASQPFAEAELDTGLIERHHAALFPPHGATSAVVLALASAALLAREQARAGSATPWAAPALTQWRLNGGASRTLAWREAGHDVVPDASDVQTQAVVVATAGTGRPMTLETGGTCHSFQWWRGSGDHEFGVQLGMQPGTPCDTNPDGQAGAQPAIERVIGRVFVEGDLFHVFCQGSARTLAWQDPLAHATEADHGTGRLTAPMPGKVIAILVETGALVAKGEPLLVMEAMKMEHTITAPGAGTVSEILYAVGDQVSDGAQLLVLEVK